MNVAIIGTAGRSHDPNEQLNNQLYQKMIQRALDTIKQECGKDSTNVNLISGGAAWSDHVAVELYLMDLSIKSLKLFIPCKWCSNADPTKSKFYDDGKFDWKTNPGGTANYYHRKFSTTCTKNPSSLAEIERAKQKGAIFDDSYSGFHQRNSAIAKSCDILIAFTWGNDQPIDGGTLDTWKKAVALGKKCIHVSLKNI